MHRTGRRPAVGLATHLGPPRPLLRWGFVLWEAIDYAQEHGTGLNAVLGYDINERTAAVVGSIGSAAPVPVEIIAADALTADLPLSICVISAPPFGLKLQEHHELLDGSTTHDGDLVVLDRMVGLLGSGGRAVLHLLSASRSGRPASVTASSWQRSFELPRFWACRPAQS